METLARFFRRISRNPPVTVVLLFGIVGVLLGWVAAVKCKSNLSTILFSVGCSLIAATLVALLSPSADELYGKFRRLGIFDLEASRDDIVKSQWVQWLRRARHRFVEIGISNSGWLGDPDFLSVLEHKLSKKVEVKMFFLDPRSSAAEIRAREDTPRPTIPTIRRSMRELWNFRAGLQENQRNLMKVYVYSCTPSSGTTWVDDFMWVTHYLPGYQNRTSPVLLAKPVATQEGEKDLYQIYSSNAEKIQETAEEVTDQNIDDICNEL
jgi:hypothetical protein